MLQRLSILPLMWLLLVVSSCAQKSSKTALKLTTAGFAAAGSDLEAVSGGGLMVWGVSITGQSFGRILTSASNIEVDLPNDEWKFFAMAWDGVGELNANTGLRCATSPVYMLNGSPVAVNLSLTQLECDKAMFKGHATTPASAGVKLLNCKDTSLVTAAVGATWAATKICTTDPSDANRIAQKAPVMSVRVHLFEHDNTKTSSSVGSSLSHCVDVSGEVTGLSTLLPIRLPAGIPGSPTLSPFRMRLDYFVNSTDCELSGETPMSLDLPNGLVSELPGKKYFVEGTNTHLLVMQIPDSTVCDGRRAKGFQPGHNFAGGDGSLTSPYLICSPEQLYAIHDNTDYTDSYRLMTDINLNTYTKALVTGTALWNVLPAGQRDCWEESENWQPIGADYTDTTNSSTCKNTLNYAINTFQGSFDGGGHTLIGMRMRKESFDKLGFIGFWGPNATNGKFLHDLNFASVELTGNLQIGTLAGQIQGGPNYGLVKNIKVSKANIEAKSSATNYVGGVVGQSDWADFKQIKIEGTWIKANGSRVGGVLGQALDFRYFREIFARSTNIIQSESNPIHAIGGLVGYMSPGSAVANGVEILSHDGMIITSGNQMGGLFGFLGAGTAGINHFYANTALYAGGDITRALGGIVGRNEYNGNFYAGYFSGSIIDECTTTCNRSAFSGHRMGSYSIGAFSFINSAIYPSGSMGTSDGGLIGAGDPNTIAATVRDPSIMNVYQMSPEWVHTTGSLPYLVKEQHPCGLDENKADVSVQNDTRGFEESNPIRLCDVFQLEELAFQASGRHLVLETGINISGTAGISIPSGATLRGSKGSLFGYHNASIASAGSFAPITVNNGTITDLNVSNTLMTETGGGATTQLSGLVGTNHGTIQDARVIGTKISISNSLVKSSGAVFANTSTGKLNKVSTFATMISLTGNVSGLVISNSGEIKNSQSSVGIYSNTAMQNVAGIAGTNNPTGIISKVTVASSLNTTSTALTDSSMGVLVNNGTMSDIHIDSRTRWEAILGNTLGNSTLARENNGAINGAIINGQLLQTASPTVTTDTLPNAKPIRVSSGIESNIISLVPSGRVLYSTNTPAEFTCVDSSPSSIKKNASYANISDTYFGTAEDFLGVGKYAWLVLEYNGYYESYLISEAVADTPTNRLQIADVAGDFDFASGFLCTKFNGANRISIIQDINTTDALVLGSPRYGVGYSGLFPNQFIVAKTSFHESSRWRQPNVLLDEAPASADWPAILDYYESVLSGGTPTAPGTWGIRDEGGGRFRIRLFEQDN